MGGEAEGVVVRSFGSLALAQDDNSLALAQDGTKDTTHAGIP